jgi:hypothetical protein
MAANFVCGTATLLGKLLSYLEIMKQILEFIEKRPAIKTGAACVARFFGFQRGLDSFYGKAKRKHLPSGAPVEIYPPAAESELWPEARDMLLILQTKEKLPTSRKG